jgi:hypothetical protein
MTQNHAKNSLTCIVTYHVAARRTEPLAAHSTTHTCKSQSHSQHVAFKKVTATTLRPRWQRVYGLLQESLQEPSVKLRSFGGPFEQQEHARV